MDLSQLGPDELKARKRLLEERIKGYKASVSVLAGACSRSSLGRKIEESEMELEEISSQLGEI